MVEQGELLPVTRAETLVFLGEGFRNIRLDTLSNDDLADISGALSSFRTRPSTDFERGLEAGAKVAEEMSDPPWQERTIPAHVERDDFGEPVFNVPERVERFKRYPGGKAIAAAIRNLKGQPSCQA